MQKKTNIIIAIMLVLMPTLFLCGCNAVDKSQFIGTWQTSDGNGTMTFTSDNQVTVTGQLGDISLSGTYVWAVAGGKITFTAGGSLGVTYDYRFPTNNQVIFTNSNGGSVTLNKT